MRKPHPQVTVLALFSSILKDLRRFSLRGHATNPDGPRRYPVGIARVRTSVGNSGLSTLFTPHEKFPNGKGKPRSPLSSILVWGRVLKNLIHTPHTDSSHPSLLPPTPARRATMDFAATPFALDTKLIDSTLGALAIGFGFSSALFGILATQVRALACTRGEEYPSSSFPRCISISASSQTIHRSLCLWYSLHRWSKYSILNALRRSRLYFSSRL